MQLRMEIINKTLWAAFAINLGSLLVVVALAAAGYIPQNWIISPLYVLICSYAHQVAIRFEGASLLLLQVATFIAFPLLNWAFLSLVLRFATI